MSYNVYFGKNAKMQNAVIDTVAMTILCIEKGGKKRHFESEIRWQRARFATANKMKEQQT